MKRISNLIILMLALVANSISPTNVIASESLFEFDSKINLHIPKQRIELEKAWKLTGAYESAVSGNVGLGVTVVIDDPTGFFSEHIQYGSKVLEEFCFENLDIELSDFRACVKGGASFSFSVDDFPSDPFPSLRRPWVGKGAAAPRVQKNGEIEGQLSHGTNMSSTMLQFAPGVNLILIKSSLGLWFTLDWVIKNRAKYNIAAVSYSGVEGFEVGRGSSLCGIPEDTASRISRLKESGVAIVTAAGNNGFPTTTLAPSCFKDTISVGAVTVDGEITSYSNVSKDLTLLAPSDFEAATTPFSISSPNFRDAVTKKSSGTSTATPVVAALFAIGKSLRSDLSIDQFIHIAKHTGTPVDDYLIKNLRIVNFKRFTNVLKNRDESLLLLALPPVEARVAGSLGDLQMLKDAKLRAESESKEAKEALAKIEVKVAAELKAKQEAEAKTAADKAALAHAQFELAAANAALADSQKVNGEQSSRISSLEEQLKVLSEFMSAFQTQVSQLDSKFTAALAGQNAVNAKLKKICSAKPKPKGC